VGKVPALGLHQVCTKVQPCINGCTLPGDSKKRKEKKHKDSWVVLGVPGRLDALPVAAYRSLDR